MTQIVLHALFVVALSAGNGPHVAVHPVTGTESSGTLVRLNDESATVQTDGGQQTFSLRDLRSIVFQPPSKHPASELPENRAGVRVQLLDGSLIVSTQYTVKQRQAMLDIGDHPFEIPTRSIARVRFRPPAKQMDAQWQEATRGPFAGDVVIVHRSRTSLDELEGVLHDITPDTVHFEFDDEMIPVKRTKLEGIVYLHPKTLDFPDVVCTVVESNGSRWRARSVALSPDKLHLVTTGGIAADIALARITRIDFAASNIAYLSDMNPESMRWTPFVASNATRKQLQQIYQPRRDRGFDGAELWIGQSGKVAYYSKGLSIHSRTLLTYRLEGKYRRFVAIAGIDSRLQGRGNVELVISGDNKELFRRTIAGTDPPVPLDLDVTGVQRLKILVDFGQSADIADHLNLCEARLIK